MKIGDTAETPQGSGTVKAIEGNGRVAVVEIAEMQFVYIRVPDEQPVAPDPETDS